MATIKVSVQVNPEGITKYLTELLSDKETMRDLHQALADACNPFVPYYTGNLATNISVTPEHVRYNADYAEKVYNRNDTDFYREVHPLASSHWDKTMMQTVGDDFTAQVAKILSKRAHENGNS